ncbi:MAG: hypothetical protein ACRDG8_05130 [Actinomycetota bacterium]
MERRRRLTSLLILTSLSCLGPILLLSSSPHGVHATNDSFVYLGAAATLAEGEGWTYPFGDPGTAVTLFPPLPSAILAIPAGLDLDPLAWTLWQNALAFGVLLLLVGWTVLRTSGGSWAATVVAMALTALGVPILFAETHVWSEPLFYLFEVAALAAIGLHLENRDRWTVVAFAVTTSLALLTRYAAVSLLVTGILLIVGWPRRGIAARLRTVALCLSVALPLSVAWSVRSLAQSGTITGRSEVVDDLSASDVGQGGLRIASWFLREPLTGPSWLGLLAIASIAAVAIAAAATTRGRGWATGFRMHPAAAAFLLFALLHPLFVIGASLLTDRSPPLNHRTLGPMFVAIVVSSVLLGHRAWNGWAGKRFRWLIPLTAVLLLGLAVIDTTRYVPRELGAYAKSRDEYGAWASSLRGTVRAGDIVLSNGANIAWFLLDRPVQSLPLSCVGSSERPDPAYPDRLRVLGRDLGRLPRTVVVIRRARTCDPFTIRGIVRTLSVSPTVGATGILVLAGPTPR